MSNAMGSLLLSTFLLIAATTVQADFQSCDYHVPYQITVQQDDILFSQNNKQVLLIPHQGQVKLHHEEVAVSTQQQKLLREFQHQAHQLLPEIADLAVEATDVGLSAMTLVFEELLPNNAAAQQRLSLKVDKLIHRVRRHVSESRLDAQGLEKELTGADFEREIESLVEEVIIHASGTMVSELVAAALSGNDEKVAEFEARMDSMGERIEQQVQTQSAKLEKTAQAVCARVERLASLDEQLSNEWPEWRALQLINKK